MSGESGISIMLDSSKHKDARYGLPKCNGHASHGMREIHQ